MTTDFRWKNRKSGAIDFIFGVHVIWERLLSKLDSTAWGHLQFVSYEYDSILQKTASSTTSITNLLVLLAVLYTTENSSFMDLARSYW